MRRINRRIVLLTLLGIAGVVAVAWWLLETQNRRMPAIQVLLEEATQALLAIDESRPAFMTHESTAEVLFLADVWIRQGQSERAKAVLQKLLRLAKGFGCRCHTRPTVHLEVAQRYLRMGDVATAESLVADALKEEVSSFTLSTQPEPLAAFFHQYLKVKSLAEARRLAEKAVEFPEVALSALADALMLDGRMDEARSLKREVQRRLTAAPSDDSALMLQPRTPLPPVPPTANLMDYYLQAGDIEAAIQLLSSMPSYDSRWLALAEKLLEAGKPERVLELFANQRPVGDQVRLLVAKHYAKQGQLRKAMAVLEQIPNLRNEYTLVDIISAAAEGGHFRKALALARGLPDSTRDPALQAVALQMIKHGYYGSAYRLTREIKPEESRFGVLIALLRRAVG
jgi:tetratricopeptide (TPR) repeat protein